jgi:hypothetical protein
MTMSLFLIGPGPHCFDLVVGDEAAADTLLDLTVTSYVTPAVSDTTRLEITTSW